MFFVYILYSTNLDQFYIGYTSMTLEDRLRRHLSTHKGFTARTKDWKIVYFEQFENKADTILREQEIKNWKSKKRIIELISKTNG
ncbi:GIY-YIG nuclease family protein [Paenimyroides baculatum]|uniref:GIY-YIG nuclease family protein n=1 Tax=Paenimyroides baculatum TaxID=2608000 RepID=A0A5M6CT33_9FLAO|nr:GIY-YIG nuclease family protein [Paenimyroides baculatum]KAA5538407.1 GIY-YIG nuclease family protein [Paenimyroides baculatum]